jgi:heme-degrading monooxygenase HmoA
VSFLNPNLDLKAGNYAVIFASERPVNPSPEGYDAMDDATMRAVAQLDGYLGYEVVRNGTDAIFVSYWRDAAAVDAWRHAALHAEAKAAGREQWYDSYRSLVCPIEQLSFFKR